MKVNENLLVTAMEECAEVQQAISKCLRFGLDNYNPDTKIKNKSDVICEFIQLTAVIEKLQDDGVLPRLSDVGVKQVKEDKLKNVEKYQEMSVGFGTLERDDKYDELEELVNHHESVCSNLIGGYEYKRLVAELRELLHKYNDER